MSWIQDDHSLCSLRNSKLQTFYSHLSSLRGGCVPYLKYHIPVVRWILWVQIGISALPWSILKYRKSFTSSLSHLDSPLGSPGAAWFSLHIDIIQLLDKYSSRGSTGSVQEQLQTRSCNAKRLSQPLPASSALLLSPPASSLPSSFCFPGVHWCLPLPVFVSIHQRPDACSACSVFLRWSFCGLKCHYLDWSLGNLTGLSNISRLIAIVLLNNKQFTCNIRYWRLF